MRQLLSHFRGVAVLLVAAVFLFGGAVVYAADKTTADASASASEGESLSESSKKSLSAPSDKSLSASGVDTFFVRGVSTGASAADFTLKRFDGGELTLSDLRGRVVLLSFWATWCVPCKVEFPALARLSEEFKGRGLSVVAIAADTKGRVESFINEYGIGDMVIVMDRYGSVMRDYGVSFFPMGVIVGADGRLIGTMTGARDYSGEASFEYFRALLLEEFKGEALKQERLR